MDPNRVDDLAQGGVFCQLFVEGICRVPLSRRLQLERLFLKYLGRSPAKHYLRIRLEHARHLIRQTAMPLLSIAIECGFASASHFSKAYVDHFGRPPSAERKLVGGAVGRGPGAAQVVLAKAGA